MFYNVKCMSSSRTLNQNNMETEQKLLIVTFGTDVNQFLNDGWRVVSITAGTDGKFTVLIEKL